MRTVAGLILRRVVTLIPLMLGVIAFVFVVLALAPNSAAVYALGDSATPVQIAAFNHAHGLDQALPVRYVAFLGDLLQGNMGSTYTLSQPVSSIIKRALPVTLQLTGLGVAGAIVIALVLGTLGALYRDRWPDQLIRVISIVGIAMPSFWLGILLIERFSTIGGGPFPSGHYVAPADSLSQWFMSLALPAIALALPVGCTLARIVRTSMVEELDKDYVRTAMGAGLPPVVVIGRNVLRNALITPLTALGLQIGYLIGGAVVIEAIFSLPGMGTQMMTAIEQDDIGLARGVVITIALGFIVVNLVVDVLHLVVTPRLRGAH
ncbi:MAG: ABC transporter permease [Sciscionella sp.]